MMQLNSKGQFVITDTKEIHHTNLEKDLVQEDIQKKYQLTYLESWKMLLQMQHILTLIQKNYM